MPLDSFRLSRRLFAMFLSSFFVTSAFSKLRLLDLHFEDSYSVPVLGDLHYDTFPAEKFHRISLPIYLAERRFHGMLLEFKRNAEMWTENGLKAVLNASRKVVREDAAFALQVGDLVQGDCMDDALHVQMLKEAVCLLDAAYPELPVVSACGNHDILDGKDGMGAAQAYARFYAHWEANELGKFYDPKPGSATTYGFRVGKDLWLILDFNFGERDIGIVKQYLAENPNVRYTFIATHGPVLPMDQWRCRWFYLGAPVFDEMRREMRALFAKRHAIVLAGHVHTVELRDWFGDGGRITEFLFNSVLSGTERPDGKRGNFPVKPWLFTEDPQDFGRWIFEGKNPDYNDWNPWSRKCTFRMKSLYDEYRPGLKRFWEACCAGHFMLRISDSGVWVDYYGHSETTVTKTFRLR